MRIRTGKPIVLTSLLGKQNVPAIVTKGSYNAVINNNDTFSSAYADSGKQFSIISNHKYVFFTKYGTDVHPDLMWFGNNHSLMYVTSTHNFGNNIVGNLHISNATSEKGTITDYSNTHSSETVYNPIYRIAIDLTATFGAGSEPTATVFYNTYNQYFAQLANGESVVVDGKVGRVNYRNLPAGYVGLEYITEQITIYKSGLSYLPFIQFDESLKDIDSVTFDVKVGEAVGNQENIFLCSYNTSYYFRISKEYSTYLNGYQSASLLPNNSHIYNDGERHKLTIYNISVNNTTKMRTRWDWTWFRVTYLYGLSFSKNNTLIRNFLPARRVSDSALGLYDTVGNTFYTNAGTGTFIAGPELNVPCIVRGGESETYYGYNQIVNNGNFSSASGWNASNANLRGHFSASNNKMIVTANVGVTTGDYDNIQRGSNIPAGHKVLTMCYKKSNLAGPGCATAFYMSTISEHKYTTPGERELVYQFALASNESIITRYPQFFPFPPKYTMQEGDYCEIDNFNVIDLTEWYGPGNEPTTIQQFKQDFPNDYYPFQSVPVKLTKIQINNL